ncbi:histidine kinase dimerization/phospho-acceptor domain-containing protein [Escherichia coli]
MIPEQQRLLETFTLLVANAFEPITLTASEEQAPMADKRTEFRNALLAALSHDLRTPLTVLSVRRKILTLIWQAKDRLTRQASDSSARAATLPDW